MWRVLIDRCSLRPVYLIDSVWLFVFLLILTHLQHVHFSRQRFDVRLAEYVDDVRSDVVWLCVCWFVHCPVRESQLALDRLWLYDRTATVIYDLFGLSLHICPELNGCVCLSSSSAFVPGRVLIRWESWWNACRLMALTCHRKQERSNYHLW